MGLFDVDPNVKSESVRTVKKTDNYNKTSKKENITPAHMMVKQVAELNSKLSDINRYLKYCYKAFNNEDFDFSPVLLGSDRPDLLASNRKIYDDFVNSYPNICFSVGEFLYFVEHHTKNDFNKLVCQECGKNRNYFLSRKLGHSKFCSKECKLKSPLPAERTKATNILVCKRKSQVLDIERGEALRRLNATNNLLSNKWSKEQYIEYCINAFNNFDYSGTNLNSKKPGYIIENKNLYKAFCDSYPYICFSTAEFLYLSQHHTREDLSKIICPECGRRNLFKRFATGYTSFCSHQCADSSVLTLNKRMSTNTERFGVPHSMQAQKVKEKCASTCREKYGCDNPGQSEESVAKRKATCLEIYGTEHPSSSEQVKEKLCASAPEMMKKMQSTNLQKYGVKNPLQNEECKRKKEETCLRRFGHRQPSHCPEIIKKIDEAKRRNGTLNTSSSEEKLFALLTSYFPKVLRQYKEKRYPFRCDFYVPINDLFIELNEHFTHGGGLGFFDKNNPVHLAQLEKWKSKEKSSKLYSIAIKVWTESDIKKLHIAQKNNLNYKAFFNLKEAEAWLSTLKPKSYYNNLRFKNATVQSIWDDKKNRSSIVAWCRENLGLGLGEIKKKEIAKAASLYI